MVRHWGAPIAERIRTSSDGGVTVLIHSPLLLRPAQLPAVSIASPPILIILVTFAILNALYCIMVADP